MKTRFNFAAASILGATMLACSGTVLAGALTLNPTGTLDEIPGVGAAVNDLVFGLYGANTRDGYYGSQVNSSVSTISFEYLGKEAGFFNQFQIDLDGAGAGGWTTVFDTTSIVGTVKTYTFTAATPLDPIPFRFVYNDGTGTVVNGSNPNDVDGTAGPNFFATVYDPNDGTLTSGRTIDLFLDDGGANDDDNHDDLAVRLTAVPIPAAAWLFGSALLGMIGVGTRRTRKV